MELEETRRGLHAVAEQVLAGARHRATGRIGLRVSPGGFATPAFDGRVLRVDGTDLVVERDGRERRAALVTVAAAAAFAGVEPGAPAETYTPATPVDPDRPLGLDPAAAARLAAFFATVDAALAVLVAARAADADPVQLWPEHFDLATTVTQVNVGGSPGDELHPEPYLYVGPWDRTGLTGPFWNEPFGASRPAAADLDAATAREWFEEGLGRVAQRDATP
jgi:hypothetical protein